jgi:hypothetical protein
MVRNGYIEAVHIDPNLTNTLIYQNSFYNTPNNMCVDFVSRLTPLASAGFACQETASDLAIEP